MFYGGPLKFSHLSIDISTEPKTFSTPSLCCLSLRNVCLCHYQWRCRRWCLQLLLSPTGDIRRRPPPLLVLSCHLHIYHNPSVACRRCLPLATTIICALVPPSPSSQAWLLRRHLCQEQWGCSLSLTGEVLPKILGISIPTEMKMKQY